MHYPLGTVKRNIQRADRGAVEQLGLYGVATVHEAMGRLGLMAIFVLFLPRFWRD